MRDARIRTGRFRNGLGWAGLVAACSLFAFSSVFSWYPLALPIHNPGFQRALIWELLRWNLWLPLSVLIRRWDRARPRGVWMPVWRGAAVLAFPPLHTALLLALYFPFSPAGLIAFVRHRSYALIPDLLEGAIVVSLVLGLAYARRKELRASLLEAQLAQAQLDALKMQLQPHFLFNTLNAIAALQMEDPPAAQRMLVRLADFLRLTLENSGVQEVSVEREVDFLSQYLEIERARFPQKLTVRISVDPETRGALVPNLILQPIVENAIRHGIATRTAPGRVEVHAVRSNGSLLLRVLDTGPGIQGAVREGRGLAITRSRLERLYGSSSNFSIENSAGGGLEARIEIPFRKEICGS